MNDKYPEEVIIETPEAMDIDELEDKELEEASGGLVPVDDGNCHNTQCCG